MKNYNAEDSIIKIKSLSLESFFYKCPEFNFQVLEVKKYSIFYLFIFSLYFSFLYCLHFLIYLMAISVYKMTE